VELHAPGALADPERLLLVGRRREADGGRRRLEGVGVREQGLEAVGEDAEHRVAPALVGERDLVEPGLPARRAADPPAGRVRERLAPEADGEERRPRRDEAAQELVLVAEPRMRGLLADVHPPAEDEDGVEAGRRRPLRRQLPLDELVARLTDGVAEELGADERAVDEGEDAHAPTVARRARRRSGLGAALRRAARGPAALSRPARPPPRAAAAG
jgi:hypothetical protein